MDNLNDILKDRVIKEVHAKENTILIHLKPKEKPLPKSWEEFCEMFPLTMGSSYITDSSRIRSLSTKQCRLADRDANVLPDLTTAEAVLALSMLIQLRNCYNGDWVPDWFDYHQTKYVINLVEKDIVVGDRTTVGEILYFKTAELRNEFLRYFRPLIEKIKPLYGIKEVGAK